MVAATDFQVISHDEVYARLMQSPGVAVSVVTPNHRLALVLQREFGERQAALGKVLWESPDILPWSGFLERACGDARYSDVLPLPLVLSPAQSHALWENLLRNSPTGAALLAVADAARLAHEAWQLTRTWRLEPRLQGSLLNEDGKAFQDWAPRYERTLQRNGQMDAAELADRVLPLMTDGHVRRPQLLVAYGFDSFTPQQSDFFAGLQQAGSVVLLAGPLELAGRVLRTPCADAEAEIRSAAAWARTQLEAGHRRIGIVVPNLAARRAAVVRLFSAAMAPDYALPDAPPRVLPFNLSLGVSLADYPLVNTALLLLELAGREIQFERASRVLRSPFIADAETERSGRALLDIELRGRAEPAVTLERLQNLIVRHGADCPQLARHLTTFVAIRKDRLFGAQAPSLWAEAFSEALAAMGFPGERALDSVEYQTLKRWHEVIAGFAALDRVVPRMAYAEALSRLRRMAVDTLFQPETPDVPIQILGVLETSGLIFDRLWVMGLGDEHWPPPQRPNPFLPLAVQRAAGLPQCSPTDALASARSITARWCSSADAVVLSYPMQEADRELRPSTLIVAVAEAQPDITGYPDFRGAIHALQDIERLVDDVAPPVTGPVVGAGTALLKDQAACPFRAGARHRLRATTPDVPHAGLDALERGTLVHNVLARAWAELRTSDALVAISGADLDVLLADAADAAMERIRRERPAVLSGRFSGIEKNRLTGLARAWLEEDRKRGAFTVLGVEDKRSMMIGGLQLNARLDRVDETTDGRRMVIDYKTGKASAGDMLGERPEEPQLPLYLLTAEPDAAAVAFARVRAGNMAYAGLARDGDLLPGIKAHADTRHKEQFPGWPDLVATWRRDLERLAVQFATGVSMVDPKRYPQTCQYCDQQPFCRIRERLGEPVVDGEPGE
jgi:ATP-dependent helicase/nuclease subunit B